MNNPVTNLKPVNNKTAIPKPNIVMDKKLHEFLLKQFDANRTEIIQKITALEFLSWASLLACGGAWAFILKDGVKIPEFQLLLLVIPVLSVMFYLKARALMGAIRDLGWNNSEIEAAYSDLEGANKIPILGWERSRAKAKENKGKQSIISSTKPLQGFMGEWDRAYWVMLIIINTIIALTVFFSKH